MELPRAREAWSDLRGEPISTSIEHMLFTEQAPGHILSHCKVVCASSGPSIFIWQLVNLVFTIILQGSLLSHFVLETELKDFRSLAQGHAIFKHRNSIKSRSKSVNNLLELKAANLSSMLCGKQNDLGS